MKCWMKLFLGVFYRRLKDKTYAARQPYAGIPNEVPAFTLNKVCGSGLRVVSLAAQIIRAGDADIILAGGMETCLMLPMQ